MFHRFRYESEFYPTLSRLPLHVRMKLDLTGIKISLKDWLAFSFEERTVLCHLPIEAAEEIQAFTVYINFLSLKYQGKPAATTDVMNSAACLSAVTLTEWAGWQAHERHALYKTAISHNQPEAFEQVLKQLREGK